MAQRRGYTRMPYNHPNYRTSLPSSTSALSHSFPNHQIDADRYGHTTSTGKGILIGLLSATGSAILIGMILTLVYVLRYTNRGRIFLDRIGRPGEYDDEQAFIKEEAEALEGMDERKREEYLRAKAFVAANPPESAQTDISLSQFLAIQEKGVQAWEFEPELEIANCFVMGRTEIEFFDSVCSVQTNLPVPKQNEVYYWETKIYDMPENTEIGIGFSTKPYPLFRLPGFHKTSVAYLSPGHRRFNQPFTPHVHYGPPYVVGDVIGTGYRPRTGTVFFTRNGRKLEDITHTLKTPNLFPTIGATGPCKVHVNFGQMGFVFIEAQVKKWGLAPMTGSLAPPPPYGSEAGSILLEGGQHGIREGEGWTGYGSWASNAGQHAQHQRARSGQVRSNRGQPPRSPGPTRSPTDISLAQLEFEDEEEDEEEIQEPYRDYPDQETPRLQQPRDQRQPSLVDFVGALRASEGLQNLNLPPGLLEAHLAAQNQQVTGPPPPEYESPTEEEGSPSEEVRGQQGLGINIRESRGSHAQDVDATPRQGDFVKGAPPGNAHEEDQTPLLDGQAEEAEAAADEDGERRESPPIPTYDAAIGRTQ